MPRGVIPNRSTNHIEIVLGRFAQQEGNHRVHAVRRLAFQVRFESVEQVGKERLGLFRERSVRVGRAAQVLQEA